MCGIFAYTGSRNDAPEIVFKGLKQLEYRGYDSWGIAFVPKNAKRDFIIEKHVGKISFASLKNQENSSLAVGHTRWATHGGVTILNAHPHFDSKKEIAIVHNGIVENYQDLKKILLKKGYLFTSETDTEVVAHLIEDFLKKTDFKDAVHKAFLKLLGLNAFAVIHKKTNEIIIIRRGSPLALGFTKDGYYVASDVTAMAEYTNSVYFLDDNDMVVCTPTKARRYDVKNLKEKKIMWQRLSFLAQDLSKGKFKHFMLKEISEQPKMLSVLSNQLSLQIHKYTKNLKKESLFVGCGTAYHAALAGTYLFSLIAKKRTAAVIGSEFAYSLPFVDRNLFVSFISQSGETIDIIEHALVLKKRKIPFGTIVNRLGSTLERATDKKILLSAGPEQCVLATKSFTAKLGVLFLLAHELAGTKENGYKELKDAICKIPTILSPRFKNKYLKPLAKKLVKKEHIFVIGRGISYPIALEAALKIKEVTYIHTEGFTGGDLKHGIIALIEKDTPCIVFAPHDETYESIISNAMEVKSRGGFIIGISDKPNGVFDFYVPIENVGVCSMISNIIAIQLLAYRMALLLGNDPDKPRNLAKSVTVK